MLAAIMCIYKVENIVFANFNILYIFIHIVYVLIFIFVSYLY